MTAEDSTIALNMKTKRPIGVWILTVWFAVSVGIFPVVSRYIGSAPYKSDWFTLFLFVIPLCVVNVIAAVAAWLGKPWARRTMVILVIVNYGWVVAQVLYLFINGYIPDDKIVIFVSQVVRAVVTASVFIWYFGYKVKATGFYQENNLDDK
ncbi:MAG: hypothetical protein M0P61_12075 [Ignavibacteriaceae bacterium]|nr:hypothetical protein [Ignavibacteriaceae bacterium]